MNTNEQHLVTQQEFMEIAEMEPATLYVLSIEGKLPIVKHNGAKLVNLSDPRAQRFMPDYQKPKDLFT
jgi:hypothetical protein